MACAFPCAFVCAGKTSDAFSGFVARLEKASKEGSLDLAAVDAFAQEAAGEEQALGGISKALRQLLEKAKAEKGDNAASLAEAFDLCSAAMLGLARSRREELARQHGKHFVEKMLAAAGSPGRGRPGSGKDRVLCEALDLWADALDPADKKAEGLKAKPKARTQAEQPREDEEGAGRPASVDQWHRVLQLPTTDRLQAAAVVRGALAHGQLPGVLARQETPELYKMLVLATSGALGSDFCQHAQEVPATALLALEAAGPPRQLLLPQFKEMTQKLVAALDEQLTRLARKPLTGGTAALGAVIQAILKFDGGESSEEEEDHSPAATRVLSTGEQRAFELVRTAIQSGPRNVKTKAHVAWISDVLPLLLDLITDDGASSQELDDEFTAAARQIGASLRAVAQKLLREMARLGESPLAQAFVRSVFVHRQAVRDCRRFGIEPPPAPPPPEPEPTPRRADIPTGQLLVEAFDACDRAGRGVVDRQEFLRICTASQPEAAASEQLMAVLQRIQDEEGAELTRSELDEWCARPDGRPTPDDDEEPERSGGGPSQASRSVQLISGDPNWGEEDEESDEDGPSPQQSAPGPGGHDRQVEGFLVQLYREIQRISGLVNQIELLEMLRAAPDIEQHFQVPAEEAAELHEDSHVGEDEFVEHFLGIRRCEALGSFMLRRQPGTSQAQSSPTSPSASQPAVWSSAQRPPVQNISGAHFDETDSEPGEGAEESERLAARSWRGPAAPVQGPMGDASLALVSELEELGDDEPTLQPGPGERWPASSGAIAPLQAELEPQHQPNQALPGRAAPSVFQDPAAAGSRFAGPPGGARPTLVSPQLPGFPGHWGGPGGSARQGEQQLGPGGGVAPDAAGLGVRVPSTSLPSSAHSQTGAAPSLPSPGAIHKAALSMDPLRPFDISVLQPVAAAVDAAEPALDRAAPTDLNVARNLQGLLSELPAMEGLASNRRAASEPSAPASEAEQPRSAVLRMEDADADASEEEAAAAEAGGSRSGRPPAVGDPSPVSTTRRDVEGPGEAERGGDLAALSADAALATRAGDSQGRPEAPQPSAGRSAALLQSSARHTAASHATSDLDASSQEATSRTAPAPSAEPRPEIGLPALDLRAVEKQRAVDAAHGMQQDQEVEEDEDGQEEEEEEEEEEELTLPARPLGTNAPSSELDLQAMRTRTAELEGENQRLAASIRQIRAAECAEDPLLLAPEHCRDQVRQGGLLRVEQPPGVAAGCFGVSPAAEAPSFLGAAAPPPPLPLAAGAAPASMLPVAGQQPPELLAAAAGTGPTDVEIQMARLHEDVQLLHQRATFLEEERAQLLDHISWLHMSDAAGPPVQQPELGQQAPETYEQPIPIEYLGGPGQQQCWGPPGGCYAHAPQQAGVQGGGPAGGCCDPPFAPAYPSLRHPAVAIAQDYSGGWQQPQQPPPPPVAAGAAPPEEAQAFGRACGGGGGGGRCSAAGGGSELCGGHLVNISFGGGPAPANESLPRVGGGCGPCSATAQPLPQRGWPLAWDGLPPGYAASYELAALSRLWPPMMQPPPPHLLPYMLYHPYMMSQAAALSPAAAALQQMMLPQCGMMQPAAQQPVQGHAAPVVAPQPTPAQPAAATAATAPAEVLSPSTLRQALQAALPVALRDALGNTEEAPLLEDRLDRRRATRRRSVDGEAVSAPPALSKESLQEVLLVQQRALLEAMKSEVQTAVGSAAALVQGAAADASAAQGLLAEREAALERRVAERRAEEREAALERRAAERRAEEREAVQEQHAAVKSASTELGNEVRSMVTELRSASKSFADEMRTACQAFQNVQQSLQHQATAPPAPNTAPPVLLGASARGIDAQAPGTSILGKHAGTTGLAVQPNQVADVWLPGLDGEMLPGCTANTWGQAVQLPDVHLEQLPTPCTASAWGQGLSGPGSLGVPGPSSLDIIDRGAAALLPSGRRRGARGCRQMQPVQADGLATMEQRLRAFDARFRKLDSRFKELGSQDLAEVNAP